MIVQDQSDVFEFLADPSNHPGAKKVECIETHISAIFLAGDKAYKLKRAVHLPYADFSTPDIRLAACEKELALNHKTSPEIYSRVRRISRNNGVLSFQQSGELIDSVVEMRRFEQKDILDQVAGHGDLTPEIVVSLAQEIVKSHENAPTSREEGVANIQAVLDINKAGFNESQVFSQTEVEKIDQSFRVALKRLSPLLQKRALRGCIKRCHGDLHLGNICMFDGRPQLFDCIDFNDQLATVDVLYDLAFLAMDLWHRELHDLASLLVNHYLDSSDEEDGFACLPFFIALRAAVRAHVLATQSGDTEVTGAQSKRSKARSYYELALSLLRPNARRLITFGGLSGSGKSTIASKIAPHVGLAPGARLIESDVTRKVMFGVKPEVRLPESAYRTEVSDKVYAKMFERVEALLADGCPVVADAVFNNASRREAIEAAARKTEAHFTAVWLRASASELKERIEARRSTASDATVDVLEIQLATNNSPKTWQEVQTTGSVEDTVARVSQLVFAEESKLKSS